MHSGYFRLLLQYFWPFLDFKGGFCLKKIKREIKCIQFVVNNIIPKLWYIEELQGELMSWWKANNQLNHKNVKCNPWKITVIDSEHLHKPALK